MTELINDPNKVPKRFAPLQAGASDLEVIKKVNELVGWANFTDYVVNKVVDNFSSLLQKLTDRD